MVIEFVGLPGSGKSTIAKLVHENLAQKGMKVESPTYHVTHELGGGRRKAEKFVSAMTFILSSPGLAWSFLAFICSTKQARASDTAKLWLHMAFLAGVIRDRNNCYLLLDQGPVQGCASVGYRAQVPVNWNRALSILERGGLLADVVIVVDTTPETALRRLSGRTIRQSRAEGDDIQDIYRFATVIEEILYSFDELGSLPRILRIQNRDATNPSFAAEKAIKAIISTGM